MGLAQKSNLTTTARQGKINPDFISNLTHEFLTPLSIISLNIQIIERLEARKQEMDSSQHKYLSTIKGQVKRLNEVVKDSMELLKLDTRNEIAEIEPTDILEMLEAIKDSTSLCQHSLLFRTSIKEPEVMAHTDQRLLRTSVFRLIQHACHTLGEKVPELNLKSDQEFIIIEVLNYDLTLDTEDFNHIFNPFKRTTELEKIEGLSLALTIIKNRLKLVGAQFHVENIEPKGIKYTIMVPKA